MTLQAGLSPCAMSAVLGHPSSWPAHGLFYFFTFLIRISDQTFVKHFGFFIDQLLKSTPAKNMTIAKSVVTASFQRNNLLRS